MWPGSGLPRVSEETWTGRKVSHSNRKVTDWGLRMGCYGREGESGGPDKEQVG